jgi:hypothetical protein
VPPEWKDGIIIVIPRGSAAYITVISLYLQGEGAEENHKKPTSRYIVVHLPVKTYTRDLLNINRYNR